MVGTAYHNFNIAGSYQKAMLFIMIECIHTSLYEFEQRESTKSIEALALEYEDDKNSMISITERDVDLYEDFYAERDYRIRTEESMNMIFFGPASSFMRLDAESILHLLVNTRKRLIPITRALLMWDIITDGKTAAFLQGREFMAFSSLLDVVPEEDLYYVNFGDPSVLKFFSKKLLKINKRKYGVLASAYRRYFGNTWYMNSTYINELGYLLCGFSSNDLKEIPPTLFRDINTDVLSKLTKCDYNQTMTLYKIAIHLHAYGEPYKWTSHEVGRLGTLFTCIPKEEISAIRLEAMTALTPNVMKIINQEKLEYFTKEQILRMRKKTRRIYILRMQLKSSLDMSQIAKQNTISLDLSALFSFICIISCQNVYQSILFYILFHLSTLHYVLTS